MHEYALAVVKCLRVGGKGLSMHRVGIRVEKMLFVCDFSYAFSSSRVDIGVFGDRERAQRQAGDRVVVYTVNRTEIG